MNSVPCTISWEIVNHPPVFKVFWNRFITQQIDPLDIRVEGIFSKKNICPCPLLEHLMHIVVDGNLYMLIQYICIITHHWEVIQVNFKDNNTALQIEYTTKSGRWIHVLSQTFTNYTTISQLLSLLIRIFLMLWQTS